MTAEPLDALETAMAALAEMLRAAEAELAVTVGDIERVAAGLAPMRAAVWDI